MDTIHTQFKLLGDSTRLRIVVLLLERSLCVGHLQQGLDLEQSNTSKQLRVLRDAQIVSSKKYKNKAYYTIHPQFITNYSKLVVVLQALRIEPTFSADIIRMQAVNNCGCGTICDCKLT